MDFLLNYHLILTQAQMVWAVCCGAAMLIFALWCRRWRDWLACLAGAVSVGLLCIAYAINENNMQILLSATR